MESEGWNDRYRDTELVWGRGANQFVVAHLSDVKPGLAIDLAAGEGRNAVWLAERGWTVTAVDFSTVGVEKARQMAEGRGVDLDVVVGDARTWEPDTPVDLVVIAYLQIPDPDRTEVLRRASGWLAPGGTLFIVAHDQSNVSAGYGGPPDPAVCYDLAETVAALDRLTVTVAQVFERLVDTPDGQRTALDTVVSASAA